MYIKSAPNLVNTIAGKFLKRGLGRDFSQKVPPQLFFIIFKEKKR